MPTDTKDIEVECHCPCHLLQGMHCIPCCYTCRVCGMRIKAEYSNQHYEECGKNNGKIQNIQSG